jgi:hypothetical protein
MCGPNVKKKIAIPDHCLHVVQLLNTLLYFYGIGVRGRGNHVQKIWISITALIRNFTDSWTEQQWSFHCGIYVPSR